MACPVDEDVPVMSQDGSQESIGGGLSIPVEQRLDNPSAEDVLGLVGFGVPHSSLFPPGMETFNADDQTTMFQSLQDFVRMTNVENIQELHRSFGRSGRGGAHEVETLDDMRITLNHLWACKSDYLPQAAELLANESRDGELTRFYIGEPLANP